MALYIGLLLVSFIITSIVIVPFIDLLYRLHLTHHRHLPPTFKEEEKAFSQIHLSQKQKIGTPIGGGILIITLVSLMSAITLNSLSKLGIVISRIYPLSHELNILFFTFISFGLIGFYDDIVKTFNSASSGKTISPTRKNTLILLISSVIGLMLYLNLHIDIIHLPFWPTLKLGWLFVPLASLTIAFFAKAFDITDGMDGLAGGVLFIALIAFWAISVSVLDSVLTIFIALWIGSLLAFLYFNVYPARIWLGNTGSLAFGGTLAVIAILLGKTTALLFTGLVFVVEAVSQFVQAFYVRVFHKPLFVITPLHYLLQSVGWPEPKIVMRLWLLSLITSVLGLWLAEV